jgi:hypothetical protein
MNWGMVIVGGLFICMLAQVAGCIAAFRRSAAAGLASLFVPGYLFLALARSGAYWPVVTVWLMGVAAVVAGTLAMS